MSDTVGGIAFATDATALYDAPISLKRRAARVVAVAVHGPTSTGRVAQVTRLGWHYALMAAAMMMGMVPLGIVLSALGHPNLDTESPEAYALAMTVSMLLPMVGWMRFLGHNWERTAEMSAAMTLPILVAAAGSSIGALPHSAAVSAMNIFMWLGMFGAMLVRWREYAQHSHI